MKTLLRALPDVVRLVARLAADPVLPRSAKIALAAAVVYLMSPVDLIPDFVPFLGYLDDALLVAVVLDGVLNFVEIGRASCRERVERSVGARLRVQQK